MRIRLTSRETARQQVDLAVCFAFEGDREPRGVTDDALCNELAAEMKAEEFRAHLGDRVVWNAGGQFAARRFLVMGLGAARATPGEATRLGAARAARAAASFGAASMGLTLPSTPDDPVEARAAIEGALHGAYRFERYLTDPDRRQATLESLELCGSGARVRQAVRRAEVCARAAGLARDLVNEAPSRMTPGAMARVAVKEARQHGLKSRVLGPPELRRLGMHAVLSVARGSSEPARVVQLTYKPPKSRAKSGPPVVLVGKGVTFDSGGLNLKPSEYMLHMKSDMAGAAAVLGAMTALGDLGCRVPVHALLGLVENMTGAGAYKPGDVLDTYAGKTVEVGNTDAEGRLVLCDLMAYAARRLRPAILVDLATLTGAVVVALGSLASGLFCRHDELRDEILGAARAAGEKLWPLPMYDEYLATLQKGPADLRNVGPRWGGAITAALFLGEFVPRSLPWAHLDIAGPAFAEQERPDTAYGATGAGVTTLLRWLENR